MGRSVGRAANPNEKGMNMATQMDKKETNRASLWVARLELLLGQLQCSSPNGSAMSVCGKPRPELTPAELANLDAESAKRRNQHAKDKEKKVIVDIVEEAALHVAQHKADVEDTEAIVAKADTLLMLGLCRPLLVILLVDAMAAARTGSSAICPPQHHSHSSSVMPEAYHASPLHGHGHTRFSTYPDYSMVTPATPTGIIDLNITPGYSGTGHSSDGMQRKQPRSFPLVTMAPARRVFDRMPLPT
ncbi:Subtilisin-like protease [Hordeum vulgare]|nr:Subtilisin-like protease [Hordeum vulgare]